MFREAVDLTHQKIIYPTLTSGKGQIDREIAHERAAKLLQVIHQYPFLQTLLRGYFSYENPLLETQVLGLTFTSPLGVAAGFDKNGLLFNSLFALGFSHNDLGTVPPLPQPGNPRPRITHFPKLQAYSNNMAFPSQGFEQVILNILKHPPHPQFNLSLNIGANTDSSQKGEAISDYQEIILKLGESEILEKLRGRFFLTLNISCHNIPGLGNLQNKGELNNLVDTVYPSIKLLKLPWVVKISPDRSYQQVADTLEVIVDKADGIVVANTSKTPFGALSGKPLGEKVLDLSQFIYKQTEGKLPIIRSGGVMTPQDFWEAIFKGGASLVQVHTAFVEEKTSTPNLAYHFNQYLSQQLYLYGFKNTLEALGQGLK